MKSKRFKVLSPQRSVSPRENQRYVLTQDNWNDHGFNTMYHLYITSPKESISVGSVKILRKGQKVGDGILIDDDFDTLGPKFVSVGQSLDYYQRLAELSTEERDVILSSLRDVVQTPELEETFSSEDGWSTSLFRDQREPVIQDFLRLARGMIHGNYSSLLADRNPHFSFRMPEWDTPVEFASPSLPDSIVPSSRVAIPERVVVLIGRNGSGKSTLLARLARVAHGTATNRAGPVLTALGVITPEGMGFPRIITVSYSAFDSFTLPGLPPQEESEPDEREQIIKDARRGTGRYVYCGLRDIASELEQQIKDTPQGAVASDRVERTLLKSVDVLAEEFERTLTLITRNERARVFRSVFNILASEPSFSFWTDEQELEELVTAKPRKLFGSWSTGQKIVAQIAASLVAYTEPRSLVLIDEPEMHLHPSLLAVLMHAVRYVLRKYEAFAVIATHSPVVAQESLGRHVLIVERDEETTRVRAPDIETFGENVSTLTSELFGLNSEVTDFHKVLDALIKRYRSLERIEKLFQPHGLSVQARGYLLSQLPDEDER